MPEIITENRKTPEKQSQKYVINKNRSTVILFEVDCPK